MAFASRARFVEKIWCRRKFRWTDMTYSYSRWFRVFPVSWYVSCPQSACASWLRILTEMRRNVQRFGRVSFNFSMCAKCFYALLTCPVLKNWRRWPSKFFAKISHGRSWLTHCRLTPPSKQTHSRHYIRLSRFLVSLRERFSTLVIQPFFAVACALAFTDFAQLVQNQPWRSVVLAMPCMLRRSCAITIPETEDSWFSPAHCSVFALLSCKASGGKLFGPVTDSRPRWCAQGTIMMVRFDFRRLYGIEN